MSSTAKASITPCTFSHRRLYQPGVGNKERAIYELKNCYINSDTFIMASSTDIETSIFHLVAILMDPIEFVEIVEPEVTYQDSETVAYSRTDDGEPQMTVTINNNEVSPVFIVPYYSLIIPDGYVINYEIDFGECEELEDYVSVENEVNPEDREQTFWTISFDLSNIYEFESLSCTMG